MSDPATGALALKVALEVVKRVPTSGLARARDFFVGNQLLVVGPPRVGKTSFVDYLRHGIILDEKDTPKTDRLERTPAFRITLGRDASLELRLRRAIDAPGQVGPVQQAEYALEYRPHGLVFVTDVSRPFGGSSDDATANWLRLFLSHLNARSARHGPKKNRTKAIAVLLNKADKITKKALADRHRKTTDLFSELSGPGTVNVDSVRTTATILITNPQGTHSADQALALLARDLVR